MEVVIRNRQRFFKISPELIEGTLSRAEAWLREQKRIPLLSRYPEMEVSVLLINDRRMREMNLRYRGKDKTTDVLSFSLIEGEGVLPPGMVNLGDIVISPAQAERQAAEQGVSFEREIRWLLIHGLLHLLGFDHERNRYQERKMRALEQELLLSLA
ncbi:MAG: rRNA maturation RNase YbeY [Nitrospirales bacterium]|nr:rRNA maturation RNase YbeY [Nitrospirales bacterium]